MGCQGGVVSQRYLRDAMYEKKAQRVRYPPLRYYLDRVLRDIGGGGVGLLNPRSSCQRAENGGSDPSWLDFALFGRPARFCVKIYKWGGGGVKH